MQALHEDPGGSPADAIAYNSDVMLVYPQSGPWAIYGDREMEIGIVADGHRNPDGGAFLETLHATRGGDAVASAGLSRRSSPGGREPPDAELRPHSFSIVMFPFAFTSSIRQPPPFIVPTSVSSATLVVVIGRDVVMWPKLVRAFTE